MGPFLVINFGLLICLTCRLHSFPTDCGLTNSPFTLYFLAGFGLVGIPENLIRAVRDSGPKELTIVSNEAG